MLYLYGFRTIYTVCYVFHVIFLKDVLLVLSFNSSVILIQRTVKLISRMNMQE